MSVCLRALFDVAAGLFRRVQFRRTKTITRIRSGRHSAARLEIAHTVTMPSKEETCQDFVEELVSEIKENLRLSGFKAATARHRKSRASPYSVPTSKQQQPPSQQQHDDPYEMLQELLRDGSLIKEAVRRLQKGLSPKQRFLYDSEDDAKVCSLEI